MKIYCDNYKKAMQVSRHLFEREKKDPCQAVSIVCQATGAPLIVICTYAISYYGATEKLLKLRQSLMNFYGYTEVIDFTKE